MRGKGETMGFASPFVAMAAALLLGGCAALAPDRSVCSTMTLAPGQTARGRFEAPDGGRSLVQFHSGEPRKGVPPHPEMTTWVGSDELLVTFPDSVLPGERRMGYAQLGVDGDHSFTVVVRKAATEPATFGWIVTGTSDAVAHWDLSGGDRP